MGLAASSEHSSEPGQSHRQLGERQLQAAARAGGKDSSQEQE